MGPYFCIMGAIFIDIVVVEPFTDWIFLGGKPEGHVTTVARIFHATANALCRLEDYYKNTPLSNEINVNAYLPSPVVMDGSPQPPSLRYTDRLMKTKCSKPLYRAKIGNLDVVVKFPNRYCEEAHRHLALHGLAPKLHFFGEIQGGLYMVVMDYVKEATTGYDRSTEKTIPHGAYEDIRRAVGLLHEKGLVFGDLRRPNILIVGRKVQDVYTQESNKQNGAVLIDFDWCGKDGEAIYPDTLNDTGDIEWAEGVKRGGLMKKEHDLYQLGKLSV